MNKKKTRPYKTRPTLKKSYTFRILKTLEARLRKHAKTDPRTTTKIIEDGIETQLD